MLLACARRYLEGIASGILGEAAACVFFQEIFERFDSVLPSVSVHLKENER